MALQGFEAVRRASQEITERKNSGGSFGPRELWPNLRNSGDTIQVRFLEQGEDVKVAWVHEYKKPNVNKSFFTPCLDQSDEGNPCPGCELGIKRKFQGYINVIQRNSPQLKRGEDGRAVKNETGQYVVESYKDEIGVWVQGITVFEDLADKDITYRGLTTRDFKITRRGSGLNTKYVIEPAVDEDGNANATPLTADDQELIKEKYDLDKEYLTPLSYEQMNALFAKGEIPSGGGVKPEDVQPTSPFARGDGESRANRFLEG
jgi:hypothetical protein